MQEIKFIKQQIKLLVEAIGTLVRELLMNKAVKIQQNMDKVITRTI